MAPPVQNPHVTSRPPSKPPILPQARSCCNTWGRLRPATPYWIGLDRDTYHAQLADLRRWADTVLRQQYSGCDLRDCWPRHTHAIWELCTLAAEWHHTYRGPRPDLARALVFHDRWLPGTMRRITGITRECRSQCVTLRSPGDWPARPSYR